MRMKTSRAATTCCLIAALATSSCSFMMSKPPPPRRAPIATFYDCSDSTVPVWMDGYWILNAGAVALVGFGGAAARDSQARDDIAPSWNARPDSSDVYTLLAIGALATGATIGLIYSAMYGARSADACVTARADFLSRQPVYPAYPVYPAPPPLGDDCGNGVCR